MKSIEPLKQYSNIDVPQIQAIMEKYYDMKELLEKTTRDLSDAEDVLIALEANL